MGQEELGLLIKQAREDARLSQAQLAVRIGLEHPQSISNYERGITEVPAHRLRKIADATAKPLSHFLGIKPADGAIDAETIQTVLEEVRAARAEVAGLRELVLELQRAVAPAREGTPRAR